MNFNIRILLSLLFFSCAFLKSFSQTSLSEIPDYRPVDQALHDEICALDKQFFSAYNNCDMETQANMMAEDIEFFHDQGGLNTSKKEIITSTKENICGKVTRTLIEGSIEVYPIKNYGAVEIGYHKFFNNQEPDAPSVPSKFIVVWKKEEDTWKMAKVISLH